MASNEVSNGTVLITRDAVLLPQAQENANEKPSSQKKVSFLITNNELYNGWNNHFILLTNFCCRMK